MKTNTKRARVFKLTPEANAAVEDVSTTTTRNLSNSVCYLINLGYKYHQSQIGNDFKNITKTDD